MVEKPEWWQWLEDACKPRKPKQEWFQKWPSWWIKDSHGKRDFIIHKARIVTDRLIANDAYGKAVASGDAQYLEFGEPDKWDGILFDHVELCVPVAADGYPAPRGWEGIENE